MKFAVIRLSSLGDIVLTTAFLVALKNKYPNCEVTYITKENYIDLFQCMPFIDKLVPINKIKAIQHIKFDKIFDLQVNLKSVSIALRLKGKLSLAPKHRLYRQKILHKNKHIWQLIKNKKSKDIIDDYLSLIGEKEVLPKLVCEKEFLDNFVIGIAPFAAWQNKMWPIENYIEVIKQCDTVFNHPTFAIFGSKQEKPMFENFSKLSYKVKDFVGNLSLSEIVKFIGSCNIFVTNDSGLMHIASAVDVPIVAIFGPTVKEFGFYPQTKSIIIEKDIYCRPCHLHGGNICKEEHFKCMRDIKPREIINAIQTLVEAK